MQPMRTAITLRLAFPDSVACSHSTCFDDVVLHVVKRAASVDHMEMLKTD